MAKQHLDFKNETGNETYWTNSAFGGMPTYQLGAKYPHNYIKKLDLSKLNKDVKNYEPKLALDGGLEGLSVIRKVIKKSSELIKIHGKLILEIGYDQREPVRKMLIENNFYINTILKDLAKNKETPEYSLAEKYAEEVENKMKASKSPVAKKGKEKK